MGSLYTIPLTVTSCSRVKVIVDCRFLYGRFFSVRKVPGAILKLYFAAPSASEESRYVFVPAEIKVVVPRTRPLKVDIKVHTGIGLEDSADQESTWRMPRAIGFEIGL